MHWIKIFEKDQNPIFVFHGMSQDFEDGISSFHLRFRKTEDELYLPLDMGVARCGTKEETIFEIIHQLADRCVPKITDAEEASALSTSLSSFRKANRERINNQPDIQLGRLTGFAEFIVYPPLQHLFRTKHQNIIGFERFEQVIEWSPYIYNFILEGLLKNIKGVKLRFVLFVESDKQPSLFYGSNEEDTRGNITFHNISNNLISDGGEDEGYMNYLTT